MISCIQEQVRNHPSLIFFLWYETTFIWESCINYEFIQLKVIRPWWKASILVLDFVSHWKIRVWTPKLELSVQNNWIKTFVRINIMFWQRSYIKKFIFMSSHLKSEGIYAHSYQDCLATLFCWFGCYQICFFTTRSVLSWNDWVPQHFW